MKNYLYIFILLCLQACSQTQVAKDEKPKEKMVIDLVGDSTQVFDNTKSGNFFSAIFSKYENDYYVLGSGITFSEGITTDKPNSYHSKSSFLIVDSLKNGNDKYVIDITPEIIQENSDIIIFKGKHSCHWELSLDGCEWMGFSDGTISDFVWNQNGDGYSLEFTKTLNKIDFQTKEEKELFCSTVLDVLSIHFVPDFTKCERVDVDFIWFENMLTVTHKYSEDCTEFRDGRPKEEIQFSHALAFEFEEKRIKNLKRIIKSR